MKYSIRSSSSYVCVRGNRAMVERFEPFWKEYEATKAEHTLLLDNFDTYINRLATIVLHPSLQSHQNHHSPTQTPQTSDEKTSSLSTKSSMKTLLDCIPIDRVKEWHVQCQQSQHHLQLKMGEFEETFRSLSENIRVVVASTSTSGSSTDDNRSKSQTDHIRSSVEHLLKLRQVLAAKVVVHEKDGQQLISSSSPSSPSMAQMVQKLVTNYETVVKRVAETTQLTTSTNSNGQTPSSSSSFSSTTSNSSMSMSYMFGSTHVLEACRGLDELFRDQCDVVCNCQYVNKYIYIYSGLPLHHCI
jgi:hypothetical protein